MSSRSRTRPRRRDRKKSGDRLGVLIIAGVALVVLAGGGVAVFLSQARVTLDESFCPADGPTAVTAVLIDRTDVLNPVQQAHVREELLAVSDEVPTRGLFAIYSVGSTEEGLLQPEFWLCNPGRGDELSELTGNPRLAEQRWKEFFGGPLQQVFDSMLDGGAAQASPILESIQSVALTAFSQAGVADKPKRLVIVSDMLQHTSGLSHYRGDLDFSKLRADPYYQKVRTDLGGADVRILYVHRPTAASIQDEWHLQFWLDYFLDQSGTPRFKSIQG